MKYRGTIRKIFYKNDNWSSCLMAVPFDERTTVERVITGIPNPIEGVTYKFDAESYHDPKYGTQFRVTSSVPELDDNQYFVSFLASYVKGVGNVTAKDLYDKFGDKLLDVIEKEPEKLMCVKRITKRKLDLIIESYKDNFGFLKVSQKLHELTEGTITPNKAKKIYSQYKDKTIEVVKKNPYVLTDIDGFGFLTVDKLALSMGIERSSIFRAKAAIMYVLRNASSNEGHTYLVTKEVEERVMEVLTSLSKEKEQMLKSYLEVVKKGKNKEEFLTGLSEKDVSICKSYIDFYKGYLDILSDAVIELYNEGKIELETHKIYDKSLFDAEKTVAEIIYKMSKSRPASHLVNLNRVKKKIDQVEKKYGYTLDKEQTDAAFNSLGKRISVITGGAGRGKTTIMSLIIAGWKGELILCAPTGRAAQRMAEATGHEASTIHRAIYNQDRSIVEFTKNSLVIVDESSMINMLLARDLLVAARNCHIIFVGDSNQLPPIGAGNLFAQLIKSPGVCISRLVKAYRNMGSINTDADLINSGKKVKDLVFDERAIYKEIKDKEDSGKEVLKYWKECRKTYEAKDIRVLSPMKKRGHASVSAINEMIRDYENPITTKNKISDSSFRIGDRVMQTKNNYQMECISDGKREKTSVFNGETGTITSYNEDEEAAVITLDTGEEILYYTEDLEQLELSYATTVHKSQGSEYKCIIFICTNEHYVMLKRNLLYTGVTRAKEMLYLLGMTYAYNKAIGDTQYKTIHCGLAKKIEELMYG